MKTKMNILGIGANLIAFGFPYILIVIVLESFYPKSFNFTIVLRAPVLSAGLILIMIGLVFLIFTLQTFNDKFNKGELITSGTYSLCRNPIYASWILFIIPGIALSKNSWLILIASLLMYVVFKFNIKKEEQVLRETFGNEYLEYKNSVNELFPFPNRWRKKVRQV
jgi:protein-S-isoprenylcysteine O-methyltransferase Ste14